MTRSATDPSLFALRPPASCLPGLLALGLLACGPAAAQGTAAAETTTPRFSFAPVEGGALKLDRETGVVSLCAKRPSGFTCEVVPDARDAYEAEIARLKAEVDGLRRGMAQAPGQPAPAPGAKSDTRPDTSDLDQAFAYAERFYRRLKGLIDELRTPSGEERL
ncbi:MULTISPECIES: hypothetical protein [Xanthobacter]|uniref:hypothetical protein n=1 Tax=Xanthobacter TaxID=279 RepID=UPI0024AD1024|nr:hypothetical protein [Xanthobacter autotrophicus]